MRLQLTARIAVLAILFAPAPGESRPPPRPVSARAAAEMAVYTDTDHVDVATPGVSAAIGDPGGTWSLVGRYLVDAVSAASVDIVSSASARWEEYRHVGSLKADFKPNLVGLSLSGAVSSEPDYLSAAAGATVSIDLRQRTVNPFAGYSYAHDNIGRVGEPLEAGTVLVKHGLQAGTVLILDPSTVGALVLDGIFERGDQSKPYRYLPLLAPGSAGELGPGASIDEVNAQRLPQRPRDRLPEVRDRWAITGRLGRRFARATLRLDERLYADSWGLRATTTDARLPVDAAGGLTVGPHLRFHGQSGVSFWRRAYEAVEGPQGQLLAPSLRTGDRELGPLWSVTTGAAAAWRLPVGGRRSLTFGGQVDVVWTRFLDALYVTRRRALFGVVSVEAAFE